MGSLPIGVTIRQWLTIFCLASAASLSSPGLLIAGSEKVPSEIIDQAAHGDAIPVLVGLKVVPWQREDTLSEEAITLQRQVIHSVQDQLLNELSGTKYKVVRRYDVIPGLALEVGADALAVLAKSNHVTNVLADKPAQAATGSPGEQPATAEMKDAGAVPAELFGEVARAGTVLVLVGLKAPWSPEDSLNANLVSAQRGAIAAAQNYLLTELADTKYRVIRRYDKIPGIALEVGPDALIVLSHSAAVTNVLPDRPAATPK
jgi:hypothetical protein